MTVAKRSSRLNRRRSLREQRPSAVFHELEQSNRALKSQILAREHVETELRKIQSFFNALIESLPNFFLVKNAADGKVILVNRAAEDLFGDRIDLLGKTAVDIVPKLEAKSILDQDQEALRSCRANEDEYALTTLKRGVRWLRIRKIPVLDEHGIKKYVVAFGEDVTERRQIEDDLRQAQKMEAIGQLTGGVAHDFNNLLAVIIGNLDALSELRKGDFEQEELVQAALGAALSGAELTRLLLAFARRQPLQPKPVDVNRLIVGVTKVLARTLGENVNIGLDLDAATKPILVDRIQLQTAIANLANNARDAMPAGGELIFATRNEHLDHEYVAQHKEVKSGDYVLIEVRDNGQGISSENVDRVFEPFYSTKDAGRGTGLGLSMVFGFVKQSAGHVSVCSEPGQGTIFRLYFPPARESQSVSGVEVPAVQPQCNNGETILVVEDNSELREIVVQQLASSGFNVLEAENAERALAVLAVPSSIDLVFTDIILPGGMDGYGLAHVLAARYPRTKILLTSGFPGIRIDAGTKATVPLLSKPYRRDDLIRKVREILDERAI